VPHEPADSPLHDPKAELERALRAEYLRDHGHDEASLKLLSNEAKLEILRQASIYVAAKLAEVDARSTYVHDIHGASSRE
jgi:hypothetical protein